MATPLSEAPIPLRATAQLVLPVQSSDVGPVADKLRAVGMRARVLVYSAPDGAAILGARVTCKFTRFATGSLLRLSRGPQTSIVCGANVMDVALSREVEGPDGKPLNVSGCITRCSGCDRPRV